VRYITVVFTALVGSGCANRAVASPEPVNTGELVVVSDAVADSLLRDVRADAPQIRGGLQMGTPFDTFSSAAHTANARDPALANRRRLQRPMESEGFVNYDQEWWHHSYSLPDPVRFDRIVR
jgi:D-alanyl-D-alanine dipeptidase